MATDDRRAVIGAVLDLAEGDGHRVPNVDLALAALSWASGMSADAGPTIFTVARVAGWTAHYLEELDERPLRFRARAVYASAAGADPPGGACGAPGG